MNKIVLFSSFLLLLFLSACRGDEKEISPSSLQQVTTANPQASEPGFYLLNEGNMGSNRATLDYMDFRTGRYHHNIYAETNPHVPLELGDVGNDLKIYGAKLYAVVNASHLIEVMQASTAKHLAEIPLSNCRNIVFKGRYAYATSYAGPIRLDPNARPGIVAKIDTATLKVVAVCVTGYQPEELAIAGDKLYVANSGGYRAPHYDYTLSEIDLRSFREIKKIPVGINLQHLFYDGKGSLWVSSRGNYKDIPPKIYCVSVLAGKATDSLAADAAAWWKDGNLLYVTGTDYAQDKKMQPSYALIDLSERKVIARHFISPLEERKIRIPYGVAVNPATKEIYVADAGDFVSPGSVYAFSPSGKLRWKAIAGNIPAHFAFMK